MVQVHLSTIRPVIRTEGFHQINEASSGLPKAGGLSPNNIPRRPVNSTSRQSPVRADNPIHLPTIRESRSDCQSQEIYFRTNPEARVSGFRNTLPVNVAINSRGENEENPTGFPQTVGPDSSVSEGDSPICRQSNCYHASIAISSPSLQSTTVSDEFCAPDESHTERGEWEVRYCSTAEPIKQSRSVLVAIPGQEVRVKPHCTNSPVCDNRVRCIQQGLAGVQY